MFAKLSHEYFELIKNQKNFRKQHTNSIKLNMVILGHKLGYRVYTNGLTQDQISKIGNGFVNKEWLYDIHWYKDKKGEYYMPEILSLAAESELGHWKKGDSSKMKNPAVKFDFQKLLITNAELRLLVFKTRSKLELEELNLYFEKAIKAYPHLTKKSLFLFVCFEHETKNLFYCEKHKT